MKRSAEAAERVAAERPNEGVNCEMPGVAEDVCDAIREYEEKAALLAGFLPAGGTGLAFLEELED